MNPQPERLPQNYYYGGGADTFVSAPALCLFVLCCVVILFAGHRKALSALLISLPAIPLGNVVVLAGLHWMLTRLLLLTGAARAVWSVTIRKEPWLTRWSPLDKTLVVWAVSNVVMYTINWGRFEALVGRLGFLYTSLGGYLLLRHFIRNTRDINRAIISLAAVCILIAPFMLAERINRANYYLKIFGGGVQYDALRDGKIRAAGPFAHPSIAGTVGAMLVPLFVGLYYKEPRYRLLALAGIFASVTMVVTANSGTPVLTLLAGIAALSFWPMRRRLRLVRWGVILGLVALQVVMKAPVWYLIARVSALSGGGGWHRAELVNQAVLHFDDWWLLGTKDNAYWGVDMWDVDNAYVAAAYSGGLLILVLYIWIFVTAYSELGRARREAPTRSDEKFLWALGSTVFANMVGFIGIVYFDQSAIAWYTVLAIVSAVSPLSSTRQRARTQPPRVEVAA